MAGLIEPRGFVESDRVNDQRVAFPAADGVPEKGWIGIFRMPTAVGVNRPPDVRAALEDEEDPIAQLKDLKWERRGHQPRNTRRQTARFRIVLLKISLTLLVDASGPGLKRDDHRLLDRRSAGIADAGEVCDYARIPHAFAVPEVRVSVRQARRRANRARGGFRTFVNPSSDGGALAGDPRGQSR